MVYPVIQLWIKWRGPNTVTIKTLHKMSTWVTPPSHSSNKKFPQTFWAPLTRAQDNGGTCYYFLANMQKYVTPEKRIWCANTIAMTGHCLSDTKIGPLKISRRFWFFSKACCSTFLTDVNQRSILEFQGQFACTALSILLFLRNHALFPSIKMDFSSGSESDFTLNRQSSTSTSISFVQLVKTLITISNTKHIATMHTTSTEQEKPCIWSWVEHHSGPLESQGNRWNKQEPFP